MTSNKPRDDLSIYYLNECFTADFEEGTLTWKVRPSNHFKNETIQKRWNSRYSGTLAGNVYTRKSFELKNGFDKNHGIALDKTI